MYCWTFLVKAREYILALCLRWELCSRHQQKKVCKNCHKRKRRRRSLIRRPISLLARSASRSIHGRGEHSGFKCQKIHQNISLPMVISRVFPWKFLQHHITSVSGCLHFTFKICQTVAGTSMIRWFHEFFESRFWRVFAILPNCAVLSLYYCSFPPHSLIMHRLFFDALRAPPVKRAAAANARVNVERCVLTSF